MPGDESKNYLNSLNQAYQEVGAKIIDRSNMETILKEQKLQIRCH